MTLTCHFYIILGETNIVLIDAGCSIDISSALNLVEEKHINHDKEIICILTHWHNDHTLGLKTIASNQRSIKVFAHEGDAERIRAVFANCKVDHIVDGEKLILGNMELIVHHTPGHTKGSISISSDQGHLFTGDAFLTGDDVTFISDVNAFMR
jgi:glyoxylase-like metal-dependent hydrolase (beta-lactamase superfamily II)